MSHRHSLPSLLPAILLVALVALGLGAGYYFAQGQNSFPVTWSVNPLKIKFSIVNSFSGSAPDSFTCSPSISPITLLAASSQPDNMTLTVSPPSFSSGCGSTPDNVVVTGACTAKAISNGACGDQTVSGTIAVCESGPIPYSCVKKALVVDVTGTTHP